MESVYCRACKRRGRRSTPPQSDVVLDFSAVRRIDPNALRAMEKLAGFADGKAVKVVLRGLNVEIYKVLKLMRLTSRFSFVA